MLKYVFLMIALAVNCLYAAPPLSASQVVRLDATSDSTAQESFRKMLDQTSPDKQMELTLAMVKLNLVGVKNANEVVENPELQNFSIVRVKDRVAGMTAEQIIDLANRASDVKIEVHR